VALPVLAGACALGLAVVAGCSSAASAGAVGTVHGGTRTAVAVNEPVVIMVAKGSVNCATALGVEQGYVAAIRAGDIRGGGAPVTVDGWTCEAYPTPQVPRTGDVSECHTASAEVVAALSLPSASAATSTGN